MPFGGDCEYASFGDCVKANSKKRNPRAYCGKLMKETEEHCAKQRAERAALYVPLIPPPVDLSDTDMPPRVS